jgi:uncharacterized protein (DUF1810 family)
VDDVSDPFQLQRFIEAQQQSYDAALTELRAGTKQSHWMWFIFPQHAGLGRSPMAQFYGIRSLHEARAYLAHPTLAERYREAVGTLLHWSDRKTVVQILGEMDAMKLRSSLTLFETASGDPSFAEALSAFFGEPDQATIQLLRRA